jgi:SLOG family YspA-like protein
MSDLASTLRELHQPDPGSDGSPCGECQRPWRCTTFELADRPRRWRLLYTGSRALTDRRQVYTDLDKILAEHPVLIVRHGACRKGGDQMAVDWVNLRRSQGHDIMHDPRPAPWPLLGNIAGYMRSAYMVGLGADQCIAHVAKTGTSNGTRAAATFADWAGIPTTRIECA